MRPRVGVAQRKAMMNEQDWIEEPLRKVPVVRHADVVVAGGGPAGFVAAIASARQGARTLLVERYGFLGGGLTAGGVLNIRQFRVAPNRLIIRGIPLEYVRRLEALGGTRNDPALHDYVQHEPELSKWVIQEMVLEAGVDLLLHAWVAGAVRIGDRVDALLIESKSGRQALRAQVFVDATGDADVAHFAGAPCLKGGPKGELQPMTLAFTLSHVKRPPEAALTPEGRAAIQAALQAGTYPIPRRGVGLFPMIADDEVYANATRVPGDSTNVEDLTRAEIEGRRQVMALLEFLRRHVVGYEGARLRATAPQIGLRESRRIVGDYTLTKQDVLEGGEFPDGVCRGAYAIDIHHNTPHTTMIPLPPGQSYGIPARCLMARGLSNLLVAGRCISVDHEALGSVRVMATGMATGQAAGTMAAMAAQRRCSVRDLPIQEVRSALAHADVVL